MTKPRLRDALGNVEFKQWFLLILNVALILACAASAVGFYVVSNALDTGAAVRFQGDNEMPFVQLACYLPVGQGKYEEDILSFRQELDSKFSEQSLVAPENGSLYIDTYSAAATVNVSTDYGSAQIDAIGVGGDFFYFHPLRLISGSYIAENDLMDDLVILDEAMAWRLFGGTDLNGMTLFINEVPFVVGGVIALEDDFASKRAYTQEGSIFMSYSALSKLEGNLAIDCYEIVLPEPITGYAYGVVEDEFGVGEGDIVENSSRYSLSNLLDVIRDFGTRSMRINGVIYPYWENALRLTEDYAALLLILMINFALCPLTFSSVFIVHRIRWVYGFVRITIPEKVAAAVERYREQRLERKLEMDAEGEE